MVSVSAIALTALSGAAYAEPSEELIAAAKAEGSLTTIALPHDWCGYGAMIEGFKAKYGLEVNELNPMPARATRSRRSRPTRATPARRRPT